MSDSYNALKSSAASKADWRLQDDASSTDVVDSSANGADGVLEPSGTTADKSTSGPTSWLPKALSFDGVDDRVWGTKSIDLAGGDFSIGGWFNLDDWEDGKPHGLVGTYRDASASRSYLLNKGLGGGVDTIQLFVYSSSNFDRIGYSASGLTGWVHLFATFDNSTREAKLYFDGVNVATETLDRVHQSSAYTPRIGSQNGLNSSQFLDGDAAGLAIYSSKLSASEVAEEYSGPEPRNSASPTLSIDTTSFIGHVGGWNNQDNGTLTYVWQLRQASDDTVVASGSGATVSGSGTFSGDYYLWVRCSNDGGYDSDEDAVSDDETASGGTIDLGNVDSVAGVKSDASSLSTSRSLANVDSAVSVSSDSAALPITAALPNSGSTVPVVASVESLSATVALQEIGSVIQPTSEPSELTVDTGAIDLGNVDSRAVVSSSSNGLSITAELGNTESVAGVTASANGLSIVVALGASDSFAAVHSMGNILPVTFGLTDAGSIVFVLSEASSMDGAGGTQAFLQYYHYYLGA